MALRILEEEKPAKFQSLEDWFRDQGKPNMDFENPIVRLTIFLNELYKLTQITSKEGAVKLTEMRNTFKMPPEISRLLFDKGILRNVNEAKRNAMYKWNTQEPNIKMAERLWDDVAVMRMQDEKQLEALMVVEKHQEDSYKMLLDAFTNEINALGKTPSAAKIVDELLPYINDVVSKSVREQMATVSNTLANTLGIVIRNVVADEVGKQTTDLKQAMLEFMTMLPKPEVKIVEVEKIVTPPVKQRKKGLFN